MRLRRVYRGLADVDTTLRTKGSLGDEVATQTLSQSASLFSHKNPPNRPHIVKCLLPIAYIATAQSWSETYNRKTKYIAQLLPPNCCWLCEAFNEFNPTAIFQVLTNLFPIIAEYAAKSNYSAVLSPSRRNTATFAPITALTAILPQSASL